jgi:non-homologous end joining protein Ku
MPRSLWHGAVSFGLIYAPVDMYPTAQVIDLMEALRNSIGKRGKTGARASPKKATGKARRRA